MKMAIVLCFLMAIGAAATVSAQDLQNGNAACFVYDASGRVVNQNGGNYFPVSARTPVPAAADETDEIHMVQIGTLVAPMYNTMTGGDSDGDGLFEAYMYIKDNAGGWTFTYRGYENDGSNIYHQAFQNTAGLIPYAYGEIDGDNLPDVVGQWSSWVYVYESPAVGQYANRLVWQSPAVVNVTGYTAIGDLDQDGHWEIIHTSNSFGSDNRLILWENTGDNQFQEIYNQQVSNNSLGTKAIGDFDGDGQMEVAFSSGGGDVYVFESNGNNSLQQIYRGSMNTWNAYACNYANDMDGNGRPEFICGGSDSNRGWVTQIYEATGNDSFAVRQEIVIWDGYFGVPGVAVGDLDNDGVDEFVIQTAQALHVYKWNGQSYAEVQNIPENFGLILHGVFAYDGNNNGYDELFWLGIGDSGYWTNQTIILENEITGPPPNVDIALQWQGWEAGWFNYGINLTNGETTPETFDTWIMVQFPNGSWHGPVLGPLSVTLPAGGSVTRLRSQMIRTGLPTGTYWYVGRIGDYPSAVWDSSGFNFTITGSGAGGLGTGEWDNTGEAFNPGGAHSRAPLQPEGIAVWNSPNPFNPTTAIRYQLPAEGHVQLRVFNVSGRLVTTLVDGWREAGTHEVMFDGSRLASGVYIYRITAGSWSSSEKMILLK